MDRTRFEASLMLIASLVIIGAFIYGFISRPIVFYHIYTPLKYNETIDSRKYDLEVTLQTRNIGLSKTFIWLIVDFYNLTITDPEGIVVLKIEEVSRILIPWSSSPNNIGYDPFKIEFSFSRNSSYSLILFYIYGNGETDLSTRFHNSFAVYVPERPTALIFKNIDGFTFMRLQRR
ncbi:MAG: hypothetical protein ACUVV4_06060 [Candidatus Bathyarchaeia archaeon]